MRAEIIWYAYFNSAQKNEQASEWIIIGLLQAQW